MLNVQTRRSLPSFQRVLGAVTGALFAGLVLAVWMLIGEVTSGHPSQLTEMERQVGGWFGTAPSQASDAIAMTEEYLGQLGHLGLSAVVGVTYALVWRKGASVLWSGLAFGMAFYVVAHAVVGPLTGLTPSFWAVPPAGLLLGAVINGLFGLCTAFFAHAFDRSPA